MIVALGIVLIVAGGMLSLLNWYTLFLNYRSERYISAIPLVGAGLLGSGLALFPQTRPYYWIASVVDYGTLSLILAVPWLVHGAWCVSRINLVHQFSSTKDGRSLRIRLYRRGIGLVSVKFDPPTPCDFNATIVESGWQGQWTANDHGFRLTDYCADRELVISGSNGQFTTTELHYPDDAEFTHDSLDGVNLRKDK